MVSSYGASHDETVVIKGTVAMSVDVLKKSAVDGLIELVVASTLVCKLGGFVSVVWAFVVDKFIAPVSSIVSATVGDVVVSGVVSRLSSGRVIESIFLSKYSPAKSVSGLLTTYKGA